MTLDFEFMRDTFIMALSGIPITLEITLVSLIFAIPFGFVIAITNINKVPIVSQFFKVFISFMRGTPMILQIFLIYNSLPSLLAILFSNFNINYNIFDLNPIIYAFIVFSLSETAVLAEVFRSALLTVDKGQLEAAYSIGLTSMQGYTRIVIPQAMVAAVPVLCNSTTELIKATSLAFTMAVLEITGIAKTQAGMKLCWIEAYLVIFVIYLILIIVVEQLFKLAERKIKMYKYL